MEKERVRERIFEIGIVPVVRASSPREATIAAEAVYEGGIPIVEITLKVPGAVELIRELRRNGPSQVLVGAGTVLDVQEARRCIDAGVQFLVSPGLDLPTVEVAVQERILMIAGALTPTEIVSAWRAGADLVKVFPCGLVGGAKYIKALKGPLPQVPLVPTGGVNLNTAADFLKAGAAALGIGGDLVTAAALNSGDTKPITELSKMYLTIVRQVREAESNPALASD